MLVEQTLHDIPHFYLGTPVNSNKAILELEQEGFVDLLDQKPDTALMFGGEVVGRVDDLPKVQELVSQIVGDATKILRSVPRKVLARSLRQSGVAPRRRARQAPANDKR